MLSKPAHPIHTVLSNSEMMVCTSTFTPSSGVSQMKVWPCLPPHTCTSITHWPSCSPAVSFNSNEVHCMPGDEIAMGANSRSNTNPGRECSIFIGWDDSVFLIKYWLLVRLFQGNWCQWPSCCLRITWVLVSKANSGIPFSEILTLGVFWELAF